MLFRSIAAPANLRQPMSILLVVLAVGINALSQIRRDPRVDRQFTVKSSVAIMAYLAYGAIGTFVLISLTPSNTVNSDAYAAWSVLFFLCWIAEGCLWLARLAPRLKPLPRWIGERFYWLDGALLTAALAAIVALTTA